MRHANPYELGVRSRIAERQLLVNLDNRYVVSGPDLGLPQAVFLFDVPTGSRLHLFPLMVRRLHHAHGHHQEPDFFMFDTVRSGDKEIAVKAVQERNEVCVRIDGDFPELFRATSHRTRRSVRP
jgi:hypothetical protein